MEEIFKETYGIGVYQEQILQLARIFAGFTLGEADMLRRAIGKKIKYELDAQREKFVSGAVAKGYARDLAERIFEDVIMPFAGYGFPKAHAACYARIAYETAYLKANYPVEFMAALLSADAQRTERIMIEIEECRQMGIRVLPPDINESLRHFTANPQTTSIRFGLTAIKGIGDSSVMEIIGAREGGGKFADIEDFAKRVPARILNKKMLESLAKSGALDSLGERRTLVDHFGRIVEFAKACGDVSSVQTDLFDSLAAAEAAKIDFPATPAASPHELLQWEKETLGLYVSSHPLAGLRKYIGKKAQLIGELTGKDVGRKITLAGIVEGVKKITTKKGDTMAIVFLEDPTGKMEVTLFPRTYLETAEYLETPDTILVVGGVLDLRGGQLQLRAGAVKRASLTRMIDHAKREGFFDEDEAKRGITMKRPEIEEPEEVELVDEEGNVIAGETVTIGNGGQEEGYLGPLGQWILEGMKTENVLKALKLDGREPPSPSKISIHTIDLPPRAPKKLLLDLKKVLETFPGKERAQLKIGNQTIPLPLTINMSTVLEKKIEEVIAQYAVETRHRHVSV